ncbi:zinc ribbon domain-containing protein, partial [Priestia megaterium]|uniref:TcaA second domain-containing protein n=1 Tax=Priestia megaterium TaxID=1404 RepID=UPI00300B02D4
MDFCSNCGHKLTKEQWFCPECGQSISTNKEVASAQQPHYEQQQRSNPRKPMSKKTKVLSASILAAAIVLGGGYYAVDKMVMSPRAVSEGFVNAVKEKDIDKVKSYVNEGQIELSANDEQTKSFVEYLHHNPKVLSSINDGLLKETASYEAKAPLGDDSDDMSSPYAHLQ